MPENTNKQPTAVVAFGSRGGSNLDAAHARRSAWPHKPAWRLLEPSTTETTRTGYRKDTDHVSGFATIIRAGRAAV
jgi:hypothetical protein